MNRRYFLKSIGAALMLPGTLAALPMARGGIVDPKHWSTKGLVGFWPYKAGADIKVGQFVGYTASGVLVPFEICTGIRFFGQALCNAKTDDYVAVSASSHIPIKCEVKE